MSGMSVSLKCLHGHEVMLSGNHSGDQTAVICPLCGSVTRIPDLANKKTHEGAFDKTFVSDVPDVTRSSVADHKPPSADESAPSVANDVSETVDLSRVRAKGSPPGKIELQNDAGASSRKSDRLVTEPPDLPGYTVLRELGRGGMGVVYSARDDRRGTVVALKTLQRMSPVDLQRFKQEFRALADIAHPNLASLDTLLSDGRTWCFTMEELTGVDFLEYVWSGFERLNPSKTPGQARPAQDTQIRLTMPRMQRLRDAMQQLAMGLNALHEKGMLHRDIKPSNVMVTSEGRLVLLDFGLVTEVEEIGFGSAIHGTPAYMSPEQASGQSITTSSDWYSVGVMLYELLTGQLPFRGKTASLLLQKQQTDPTPAIVLEPGIPQDLGDLCTKLLDRNPDRRPTATDFLDAFGATELADSIRVPSLKSNTQSVELVGRESHLAQLTQAWNDVQRGETRSVFVHGRSGMGKSVLIRTQIETIRADNEAVILEGRCYEQESVPFKALDSLVDSLAVYLSSLPEDRARKFVPLDSLPLVRLFPVLGQIPGATQAGKPSIANIDQQELRQRAMNALRELLRQLGQSLPVVLYIDDLQWGDEDSADLLADLLRPPDSPRVLLIGSFRSENRDTSVCLKTLDTAWTTGRNHPHRQEVSVDSLDQADATRLALQLLDRHDDDANDLAVRIARESGGWPFFVWEIAQHVQHDPNIADQSLELDEVIWSRVNRLPEESRRLLEIVAVSGRPIPALEAHQALGLTAKGRSYLAPLRTGNFVRTTESGDADTIVETYHDRVRESVVAHLDIITVRSHNLQLALTVEDVSGIRVDDLWSHINATPEFEESGDPYQLPKRMWQRVFDLSSFYDSSGEFDRAFPFALCAAEQARKQDAQEVAEQQFQIALRGSRQSSAALRFRVHEGLGDVLIRRGKYDNAIEQLKSARSLISEKLLHARLDWKLGEASFKKGDVGAARDYSERAIRALGERPPSRLTVLPRALKEAVVQVLHTMFPSRFVAQRDLNSQAAKLDLVRARIYDQLTFSYWFSAGMNFVLWSHLRQMNLVERYPPSPELGRTYAFHAVTMTGVPMADRGIRYAERAYAISENAGDLWGRGMARCYHTFACLVLGRFHEGLRTGQESVRLLDEAGDVWQSNMARMIVSVPSYHLGDLKTSYSEAKKAHEIAVECGDFSGVAISLLFWAPNSPHTLPPGAIQQELQRDRDDPVPTLAAVYARGLELLLAENNPKEAATVLQSSLDSGTKRGVRNVCLFSAAAWVSTALRTAAENESGASAGRLILRDAKKAVRKALRITKKYVATRPHALREAGLIAALEGREDQAKKFFEDSLQVANEHHARYEIAQTNLARGMTALKFGRPDAELEVAAAQEQIAVIRNFDQTQ